MPDFNAHDHLIKIQTKQGLKDYYPAAWRLYELNLKYANANFTSDVLYMDEIKNLCVVKCRLFLGASFETSEKKTEALKSGLLSAIDKVETAAKARCARDFGISTELALDIESDGDTAEDAIEARPSVNTAAAQPDSERITPNQIKSVKNLLNLLKREPAPGLESLSQQGAKELLAELSKQVKAAQFKQQSQQKSA